MDSRSYNLVWEILEFILKCLSCNLGNMNTVWDIVEIWNSRGDTWNYWRVFSSGETSEKLFIYSQYCLEETTDTVEKKRDLICNFPFLQGDLVQMWRKKKKKKDKSRLVLDRTSASFSHLKQLHIAVVCHTNKSIIIRLASDLNGKHYEHLLLLVETQSYGPFKPADWRKKYPDL